MYQGVFDKVDTWISSLLRQCRGGLRYPNVDCILTAPIRVQRIQALRSLNRASIDVLLATCAPPPYLSLQTYQEICQMPEFLVRIIPFAAKNVTAVICGRRAYGRAQTETSQASGY